MQSAKKNDGSKSDVGLDIILFYDQNYYVKNNTRYSF